MGEHVNLFYSFFATLLLTITASSGAATLDSKSATDWNSRLNAVCVKRLQQNKKLPATIVPGLCGCIAKNHVIRAQAAPVDALAIQELEWIEKLYGTKRTSNDIRADEDKSNVFEFDIALTEHCLNTPSYTYVPDEN